MKILEKFKNSILANYLRKKTKELKFLHKNNWKIPDFFIYRNGNVIYLDWFEDRGRKVFLCEATGQRNIKNFLMNAIQEFKPTAFVDVGANYGEMTFEFNYPKHIKTVLLVEANPNLHEFILRSIGAHEDRTRIKLIPHLLTDAKNSNIKFTIDASNSGRSTASKIDLVKHPLEVTCNSLAFDDLLEELDELDGLHRILFKIDVEGHEPIVLKGLYRLAILGYELYGCIEFCTKSLILNSVNLFDYIETLDEYFHISVFSKSEIDALVYLENCTFSLLCSYFGTEDIECDLILKSKNV